MSYRLWPSSRSSCKASWQPRLQPQTYFSTCSLMVLEFFYFLAQCTLEVQLWSRTELLTPFHCNFMNVFWGESVRKSVGRRFWGGTMRNTIPPHVSKMIATRQSEKTDRKNKAFNQERRLKSTTWTQVSTQLSAHQRQAGLYRFMKSYILRWSTVNISVNKHLKMQLTSAYRCCCSRF